MSPFLLPREVHHHKSLVFQNGFSGTLGSQRSLSGFRINDGGQLATRVPQLYLFIYFLVIGLHLGFQCLKSLKRSPYLQFFQVRRGLGVCLFSLLLVGSLISGFLSLAETLSRKQRAPSHFSRSFACRNNIGINHLHLPDQTFELANTLFLLNTYSLPKLKTRRLHLKRLTSGFS